MSSIVNFKETEEKPDKKLAAFKNRLNLRNDICLL